jgi:hypothetical protein
MAYAREHGLSYSTPAGGCILTQEATGRRFEDLRRFVPGFTLSDFQLLAYGRHFRLSERSRIVIARNDRENGVLEKLRQAGDCVLSTSDVPGPLGLCRGPVHEALLRAAAAMVARFSRARDQAQTRVWLDRDGDRRIVAVTPAASEVCDRYRI